MYKESSNLTYVADKLGTDLYIVWVSGITNINEYYTTEYLLEKFNSNQWRLLNKINQ